MTNLFDINEKVIAVTGGGGVLCGTMAKALGAAGGRIAVLDLAEEAAAKIADEIKSGGGKAVAVKCNVLEKDSIEAALEKVKSELGTTDILINGAGGNDQRGGREQEGGDDVSGYVVFRFAERGDSFCFRPELLGHSAPDAGFREGDSRARVGDYP